MIITIKRKIFLCIVSFCIIYLSVYPNKVNAIVISEGGPVIFSLPCIAPVGFWTIKLTKNTGVPTPIPVIYPYKPVSVTKHSFLPATPGVTTLGNALSSGVCLVPLPCPAGICVVPFYGFFSLVYGTAIQPY